MTFEQALDVLAQLRSSKRTKNIARHVTMAPLSMRAGKCRSSMETTWTVAGSSSLQRPSMKNSWASSSFRQVKIQR